MSLSWFSQNTVFWFAPALFLKSCCVEVCRYRTDGLGADTVPELDGRSTDRKTDGLGADTVTELDGRSTDRKTDGLGADTGPELDGRSTDRKTDAASK